MRSSETLTGAGAELRAKMQKLGVQADGSPCMVQVPHRDAALAQTYRSGWTAQPRLTPPQSFVPSSDEDPEKGTRAMHRSGSAPAPVFGRRVGRLDRANATGSTGVAALSAQGAQRGNGSAAMNRSASMGAAAALKARSALGAARSVGMPAVPTTATASMSKLSSLIGRKSPAASPAASPAGACDSDSDAGTSIRVQRSSQQLGSFSAASPVQRAQSACSVASTQTVQHEGWLQKKSSGKISARWQRRFFSLRGPVLQYSADPTAVAKRSFDLRRARHVGLISGQPREIELDFNFRKWRLRASTPEEARRWVLLLDAARLLASGDDVDFDHDCSDDDSLGSSSASTGVASSAHTGEPTPRSSQKARASAAPEMPPAPPIADVLEVSPEKLDAQFAEWLPVASWGKRVAGAPPSKRVRSGLELALAGLWMEFGAAGETCCCGPEEAAAVIAHRPRSADPPEAVRAVVENLLLEYLTRMRERLERWIQECDPLAEEVADTIDWVLLDACASFEAFEAGVEALASAEEPSWRDLLEDITCFLLGEWESRSCDEVSARCRQAAPRAAEAPSVSSGAPACPDPLEAWSVAKHKEELSLLKVVTAQWESWRHHEVACDRAASVLVASLSAALRSFRSRERDLMGSSGDQKASEKLRARTRERFLRLLRELRQRALKKSVGAFGAHVPPAAAVAAAASEAASFAEFCGAARVPGGNHAAAAMCAELLEAFAAAFRHESAELCLVLAEVHFVATHRSTLRSISFDARQVSAAAGRGEGALRGASAAAAAFLQEHCGAASGLCRSLACDAVSQVLAHRWARQFRRAAPRLSACPALPRVVAADEDLLLTLATDWGAITAWTAAASSPVQPLTEVREILEQGPQSPASQAACAGRLTTMLGARSGQSLAETARWAAEH